MSFLSPLAFLLLGLSIPLLLLYFLKVRRQERRVSSLLLWDPALRDREASAFFQRLQRDPLLLLQLLALLALAVTLARPVVTVEGRGSQRTVLVLDTSASMRATDVSPSRFAAAQREALAFVKQLPSGAEVMVIEAGIQPRALIPFSRDRQRIAAAIRALEARDLPNRLNEAIRTARALTAQDPRAEIRIFTDGAHAVSVGDGGGQARVRWVGVGRSSRNVGITELALRKTFFGTFGYQAFVSMVNFSEEPQWFTFTLDVDDRPIAEQSLTLDPHVRRSVVLPFSHQGAGVLRVRLNIADDLSADNLAYAIIP
ncbi:MAG: vWA domain-containing protein, partial [Candidatus Rokuibacteriota bacterium]